jgi:hypothetical protein
MANKRGNREAGEEAGGQEPVKKLVLEVTLAARNGTVHDFRRFFLLRSSPF